MSNDIKIDFVLPWVDGDDSAWKREFNKYYLLDKGVSVDVSNKRYRDWGLLKYWFRGVEKFAPWVNKIHFVTMGHLPSWLDVNHPKINIVRHEDYISKDCLPIFNSHPIEINLHKIKDISEYFVYFNDDIFIINNCDSSIFFKDLLPCDAAVMTALDGTMFSRVHLHNMEVVNKYFNKRKVILEKPAKWFNIKYGKDLIKNILLLPWKNFTGFSNYHLPNAYLKTTYQEVWACESELLNKISRSRFRNKGEDVSQYLFRSWQLASNKFAPINKRKVGDSLSLGQIPTEKALTIFRHSKKPIICLNDEAPEYLDDVILELTKIFDEKFPEKSDFEL